MKRTRERIPGRTRAVSFRDISAGNAGQGMKRRKKECGDSASGSGTKKFVVPGGMAARLVQDEENEPQDWTIEVVESESKESIRFVADTPVKTSATVEGSGITNGAIISMLPMETGPRLGALGCAGTPFTLNV